MHWAHLTRLQMEQVRRDSLLLLNVAAIEQHGPGLPLITDSLIGRRMLEAVECCHRDRCLLLPQIQVGCSAHHMGFAGTLSVSHQSFYAYVSDVIGSAVRHGFHKILLLNSHGGNIAIGQVLVESLQDKYPQLDLAFTSWWMLCREQLREQCQSGFTGNGHAAEFEYSLVAYLAPELVDKSVRHSQQLPRYPLPVCRGDLLGAGSVSMGRNYRELTEDGTHGLVEHANAKKGEIIFNAAVAALTELAQQLLDLPPRQPGKDGA